MGCVRAPQNLHASGILHESQAAGAVASSPDDPVVCQAQAGHPHAHNPGQMLGILAFDPACLTACQGQVEHVCSCVLKLPGSIHLHSLCSQGGSTGPRDHSPLALRELGRALWESLPLGAACLPSRAARQCRDGRQPHGGAGGSTAEVADCFYRHEAY